MNQLFLIVKVIFEAFNLWKSFLSFVDAERLKDAEKKHQGRDSAIDAIKKAQTEDEFDKAQDSIVGNKP